jgi:hypothetical protein
MSGRRSSARRGRDDLGALADTPLTAARLPPSLVSQIDRYARQQKISRSEAIKRILEGGSMTSSHSTVRTLAVSIALLATPAHADQCSGRLTAEHGGLVLTTENEGVCIIGKADERKVRARCSIGRSCVVTGAVDLCKEAADCVEITRVTRAHSGH